MMKCRNFRGVRASGPFDDAFKRGFRALEKHGLAFDCFFISNDLTYDSKDFRELQALANEFPNVTIVLNHLGCVAPAMGAEAQARWRDDIAELAVACPNVVCKVGGIQMAINGFGLHE